MTIYWSESTWGRALGRQPPAQTQLSVGIDRIADRMSSIAIAATVRMSFQALGQLGDRFRLHLGNIISQSMGEAAAANMAVQIHTVDGADVCRVHVRPSGFPVDATVIVDRKGQMESETAFFARIDNGTKKLDAVQKEKYIKARWGTAG